MPVLYPQGLPYTSTNKSSVLRDMFDSIPTLTYNNANQSNIIEGQLYAEVSGLATSYSLG